jgi:methionine synthase II (cobalamin-independent)
MAPFRAEHMGSLLRPQRLLDVREAIREKGLTPDEAGLPAVEEESVGHVVKLQRELGFKAVTSGEYNRTRFWGLMWDEFDGTIRLQDAEAALFRTYHPDVVSLLEEGRQVMPGDSVIAGSKLKHSPELSQSNLHELRLVQKFVPQSEWGNIKLTMITPAWFHMRYKQGRAYTKDAYANDAEYFKDVATVYQAELDQLYKAGLRNAQFDDPGLACTLKPLFSATKSSPCLQISAPTSSARGGPKTRITSAPLTTCSMPTSHCTTTA